MDDTQFNRGPARRPVAVVSDPLLQWSTGLQTNKRTIYAGWLAEVGRNPDFDGPMELAGFEQLTIKHGSGNFVTHWAIPTANMFVIAEGVQSIGEMKHTDERYGVAFGWRTLQDGRQQSQLRARVLLRELLELGYTEPLLLSCKSTLTGDILKAFNEQYRVLDAVDAFRAQDKKPPRNPPFYACSIPIGAGQEVARGSGGQTREIAPPVADIPVEITREYILSTWIQREWIPAIERHLDETVRWSVRASQEITQPLQERPQYAD
jgi:hypothetical protein